MKELSLDKNKLTSVPAALGKLVQLENLDLSGNQLTAVPAELGVGLAALKAGNVHSSDPFISLDLTVG